MDEKANEEGVRFFHHHPPHPSSYHLKMSSTTYNGIEISPKATSIIARYERRRRTSRRPPACADLPEHDVRREIGCRLSNIGNSCYQNCILQVLYNLPEVRQRLLEFATQHPACEEGLCFPRDLCNHALEVQANASKGTTMTADWVLKYQEAAEYAMGDLFRQSDPACFVHAAADWCLDRAEPSHRLSIFKDTLEGIAYEHEWSDPQQFPLCKAAPKDLQAQPFLMLNIPTPSVPATLEECLATSVFEDKVVGGRECEGKGCPYGRHAKHQQLRLAKLPRYLIFRLLRSDNTMKKIRTPVTFSERLDMAALHYTGNSTTGRTTTTAAAGSTPTTTDEEEEEGEGEGGSASGGYELVAVVVHQGRTRQRGHYYVYIRVLEGGRWWLFDDDTRHTEVGVSKVLHATHEAYMLIYHRINDTSTATDAAATSTTKPSLSTSSSSTTTATTEERDGGGKLGSTITTTTEEKRREWGGGGKVGFSNSTTEKSEERGGGRGGATTTRRSAGGGKQGSSTSKTGAEEREGGRGGAAVIKREGGGKQGATASKTAAEEEEGGRKGASTLRRSAAGKEAGSSTATTDVTSTTTTSTTATEEEDGGGRGGATTLKRSGGGGGGGGGRKQGGSSTPTTINAAEEGEGGGGGYIAYTTSRLGGGKQGGSINEVDTKMPAVAVVPVASPTASTFATIQGRGRRKATTVIATQTGGNRAEEGRGDEGEEGEGMISSRLRKKSKDVFGDDEEGKEKKEEGIISSRLRKKPKQAFSSMYYY